MAAVAEDLLTLELQGDQLLVELEELEQLLILQEHLFKLQQAVEQVANNFAAHLLAVGLMFALLT